MAFKSHPIYDNSEALDWLFLRPDDWSELEPGPEKSLQERLCADKPWLCELAEDRIRLAAGQTYLSERPHLDMNEFRFVPIGEYGYRVFIEYFFSQRPNERSPDSDFWWAIINCPYAIAPFPTGRREAYVIDFGWHLS